MNAPDGAASLADCTFETMEVENAENCNIDQVAGVVCLSKSVYMIMLHKAHRMLCDATDPICQEITILHQIWTFNVSNRFLLRSLTVTWNNKTVIVSIPVIVVRVDGGKGQIGFTSGANRGTGLTSRFGNALGVFSITRRLAVHLKFHVNTHVTQMNQYCICLNFYIKMLFQILPDSYTSMIREGLRVLATVCFNSLILSKIHVKRPLEL